MSSCEKGSCLRHLQLNQLDLQCLHLVHHVFLILTSKVVPASLIFLMNFMLSKNTQAPQVRRQCWKHSESSISVLAFLDKLSTSPEKNFQFLSNSSILYIRFKSQLISIPKYFKQIHNLETSMFNEFFSFLRYQNGHLFLVSIHFCPRFYNCYNINCFCILLLNHPRMLHFNTILRNENSIESAIIITFVHIGDAV